MIVGRFLKQFVWLGTVMYVVSIIPACAAASPADREESTESAPTHGAPSSHMIASATDSTRVFPFNEGMSAEDLAASKKNEPLLSNPSWSHEACVISYEMDQQYRMLVQRAEQEKTKLRQQIKLATEKGYSEEAEMMKRALANVDGQVAAAEKRTRGYRNNVATGCKGLYYRLGIESVCEELGISFSTNPFCAAARGAELDGAKLTDDLKQLRYALAWNKLGKMSDRKLDFRARPWQTVENSDITAPNLAASCAPDRNVLLAASAIKCLQNISNKAINKMADKNFAIVGGVVPFSQGKPVTDDKMGTWYLLIELMRGRKTESTPQALKDAKLLSDAAGLPSDLGPFAQYPRLQFQIYLYDILFTDDVVHFYAGDAAGNRTWLGTGMFDAYDGRSPKYHSSYRSYTAHATLIPDTLAWRAIRSPTTTTLYARTMVLREDGVEQEMEFPITTAGLKDALIWLAKAQQDLLVEIEALNSETDKQIAYVRDRQKAHTAQVTQWRTSQLASLNQEVQQLIANRPMRYTCTMPPILAVGASEDAITRANQLLREAAQCQTIWIRDYDKMTSELRGFREQYKELNAEPPQQILQTQQLWDNTYREILTANRSYRQQMDERNEQAQKMSVRNQERTRSRSSSRSPRSGRDAGKRSPADEFFHRQRHPDPPYFRDITKPRRPNGYLSRGWY